MSKLNPNLKATIRAALFCLSLLMVGGYLLVHVDAQKEDAIAGLLKLPAPPPPNPHNKARTRQVIGIPTEMSEAPNDDAPIEELLEFWAQQRRLVRNPRYTPPMSDQTFDRLRREIESKPSMLTGYLGALPDERRSAEFVKNLYDREGENGAFDREARGVIKEWLTCHSPYFSDDLARRAQKAGDNENYVVNQEDLLQLARYDFDKARPLIERLAANTGKPSYSLAKWAQYRNALDTDSAADIERYRNELKAVVSDKTLSGPMRDLAMDALVTEREWPERDEWYLSLLSNESLADLDGYTGLTTIITVSHPKKYTEKMLELLKTETNQAARTAIVRNLAMQLRGQKVEVEIVRALLPWLEDANWVKNVDDARGAIVGALAKLQMPESVPGLIKMLDERVKRPNYAANAANMAANAARSMSNANRAVGNAMYGYEGDIEGHFYRSAALAALVKQADPRAVPALRRVLGEAEGYHRTIAMSALIASKGFTAAEQVEALEEAVKIYGVAAARVANVTNTAANAAANAVSDDDDDDYDSDEEVHVVDSHRDHGNQMSPGFSGPLTTDNVKSLLGTILLSRGEADDEFAAAVVDRIEMQDTRDLQLARVLRAVVLNWENSAVTLLLLRDVKRDIADTNSMVRLLATRSAIRENHSAALADLLSGSANAAGIGACLTGDTHAYERILDGDKSATKLALLACSRLIRAPLPLGKVTELAKAGVQPLAHAAKLYLESEDSQTARAVVYGLHPGEAYVTGASTAFYPSDSAAQNEAGYLLALFASVDANLNFGYGWPLPDPQLMSIEKGLQAEVLKDTEMIGIYTYDRNYVRIYKDKVVFSWDEDDARYRERHLSKEEFDRLAAYLRENQADETGPFLQCSGYCQAKELVTISRAGGRRVYLRGEPPPFFVGLDKYFSELKTPPSRIKYALSREVSGLELLLADDTFRVETVWKNGNDLRIAVSNKTERQRVKEEIDRAAELADETETNEEESEDYGLSPGEKLRLEATERRKYEGYSWRSIVDGSDVGLASQPKGVEFIPVLDSVTPPATAEQWKARFGEFEIRTDEDGVYKVSRGKAVNVNKGFYDIPVVTANGKWLIAFRDDEEVSGLIRRNLLTGKEFQVKSDSYSMFEPAAYISTLNKILLKPAADYHEQEEEDESVPADPRPSMLKLLDPETGTITPAKGEFRPFAQQTFRPLQQSKTAGKYWAAIPDIRAHSTTIGLLDGRTFAFKSVLRIPKITVNSMNVWVDEAGSKNYFVYRGHLLALPLPKQDS